MSTPHPIPMELLQWPLARAGEAMEALARQAGLDTHSQDTPQIPDTLDAADAAELGRWVDWAARRLGVEAEAIATPLAQLEDLLRDATPALLYLPGTDIAGREGGFLVLVTSRGSKVGLLGLDLRLHYVAAATLSDALRTPLEAPFLDAVEHLLKVAQVPANRHAKAQRALLREHLSHQQVGPCWMLRTAPGASFWSQVRQARIPRKVGWMLLAFAAVYAAEIAGWGLVGQITLNGHLDMGWLAAWALLVLLLVPLRLLGRWLDASFALDFGRMMKTRLLSGILQTDLDVVRRQGAGQLLSRVMEAQALESLALNGGLGVLIAVLELCIAATVLASGAGGHWHLLLLVAWLLLTVGLSYRFFHRLRDWTLLRLDMTHGLVERMVGHRTRLAQERAGRRDAQEDVAMRDYLDASKAMDHAIVPAAAVMPRGWMLVGLLGLLPGFVAGTATPGALAIALGGMLLANRALMGISGGFSALSRAWVAWSQVASLFRASVAALGKEPFLSAAQLRGDGKRGDAGGGADRAGRVIDASQLGFGYGAQGEPVLRGLDLTIHSGEHILLEGPSGGGKSTLASLLVGLRTPHSGLLLLNGLDRHTLGDSWHQMATEAPQFHENHILSGTLAFNLLMGRNWPASADELREAQAICEDLGLGDLLERMPSGILQMVGETGWQLSHGERSRVFLARALLQDTQLTVLDESFAALDPETLEKCLQCALKRSRALLVIAHP